MIGCDACHRRNVQVRAYLMDDNAEVVLCKACATQVRKECDTLTLID